MVDTTTQNITLDLKFELNNKQLDESTALTSFASSSTNNETGGLLTPRNRIGGASNEITPTIPHDMMGQAPAFLNKHDSSPESKYASMINQINN